jgi:hypothetical protein
MKKVLVAVVTAAVASTGTLGAAVPAQAGPAGHVMTTGANIVKGGTAEAQAAAIVRELYLTPPGIGDSTCRNGTLSYRISYEALPNVARSMVFKVTVPGRGIVTFDDFTKGSDEANDGDNVWYSACVSKPGYKVIARSKRLKVTGYDYETGRKVTPRKVKVYATEC